MILREGQADKVLIVSLETEEVMVLLNPHVTLHDSGIVEIITPFEETSIHLNSCEIIWRVHATVDTSRGVAKVSHLKPVS